MGLSFEQKRDIIAEVNPEALLADGFEAALVGYVEIFHKTIALYDRKKCISILVKRDGMTEEEAEEFFSFNVTGAWCGENTPAFVTYFKELEAFIE